MWNEIKTETDIDELMKKCCGFHDSCIVSVNYSSGAYVDENGGMANGDEHEHIVDMTLHSQWGSPIELHFTGVHKCSIVGWQECYFCDIFGAYLAFHTDLLGKTRDDQLIVWADHEHFNPAVYTEARLISPNATNCTYVIAKRLFWRIGDNSGT